MTNIARILVVAAPAESPALGVLLDELGHAVCATVESVEKAMVSAVAERPDLALFDLGLLRSGAGPLPAADAVRRLLDGLRVPVVLLGGPEDPLPEETPDGAGEPYGLVEKPVNRWRLQQGIRTAFATVRRERQAKKVHRDAFGSLERKATVLETVLNCMSASVAAFDMDGRFMFANPSGRAFALVTDDIASPEAWFERFAVFWPDGKTPYPLDELDHLRAIRGEATDATELVVRDRTTGWERHITITGRPLTDRDGMRMGGVIVFRENSDVMETRGQLKRTTRQLDDQARFMETILNLITDAVCVTDEKGKHIYSNETANRFFGPDHPDADSPDRVEHYGLFLPDRETPYPVDCLPLGCALSGDPSDEVEMFLRNRHVPEGKFLHVSARPLKRNEDSPTGGMVVFRDITRLKRAEAELRRTAGELQAQAQLLETYFHSIPEGVVVVDEEGKITIFNQSAARMAGIGTVDAPLEDWPTAYGIHYPDGVTPLRAGELPWVQALQGELVQDMELFLRNETVPDGMFIRMNGRPLLDETGAVRYGVGVFRDVSERVRADEALTEAFTEGRLEILDTILHNIGNAINSVVTGVSAIRGELSRNEPLHHLAGLARAVKDHREDWPRYLESDPQGQKVIPFLLAVSEEFETQAAWLAKTIDRVEKRVGHIVDIIRTQRTVDRGAMAEKDVAPRDAVLRAVRLLGESLRRRGYGVAVDCSEAPRQIRVHESRFHQMMVNLIKNSMEALDDLQAAEGLEGKPRIEVEVRTEGEELIVEVGDNGIGFSPERAPRLFLAGYTTKGRGSGLGLHSAANFAASTGGGVEALSEGPGKGATIRVRLGGSFTASRSEDSVSEP